MLKLIDKSQGIYENVLTGKIGRLCDHEIGASSRGQKRHPLGLGNKNNSKHRGEYFLQVINGKQVWHLTPSAIERKTIFFEKVTKNLQAK